MKKQHTLLTAAGLGALLLLISALPAAAETVVTVDEAVAMARDANLTLETANIDLESKRRSKNTIWNVLMPSVSATGTISRMNQEQDMTVSGMVANTEVIPGSGVYDYVIPYEEEVEISQWNLSAGLSATLTLTPAMYHGARLTVLNYQSGLISRQKAETQLERDVRQLFYNLLLFQRSLEITAQSIEAAEDRYEQAQINYRNGRIPRFQMLSARVALENQRPALEDQQIQYVQLLSQFKQLLGMSRTEQLKLEGEITIDPVEWRSEPLITAYLAGNLDILNLENTITILKMQKQLENDSRLPALTIRYSTDRTLNDPFEEDSWEDINGPAAWNDTDLWAQSSGMLSFTLSVPIDGWVPLSQTSVKIRNADDTVEQTTLGLVQTRDQLEIQVENIVRQLNKSLQSLEARELNVELAQESYDLAEESYNAGGMELLDVQNAELELQNAQLGVLQERLNYINQLLELEFLLQADRETLKQCCLTDSLEGRETDE